MDFLDPKKERRKRTRLLLSYVLIAFAIGVATLVLLYQSRGYIINQQGEVARNGMVFISSQPSGSALYVNGSRYASNTNTRLILPAGSYNIRIAAAGYRDWQRPIVVAGGDVQHFDYPLLFPTNLVTTQLTTLAGPPSLVTQSPNKRWLLIAEPDAGSIGKFIEYDFKDTGKPVQTEIALPAGSYTSAAGAQSWQVVEWASDNRHVLLLHNFTDGQKAAHEYVLVDRNTPANSINVTAALKLSDNQTVRLFDQKVADFYIYDQSNQTLRSVSADGTTTLSQLDHILAFKTYSDNMVLYATDKPPTGKISSGEVSIVLEDGSKTITLRTLPAGATSYALNLAQYSGDWYVAVGANTDTGVYLYKNPQSQTDTANGSMPVPWRIMPVPHPTFVGFSSNTQFVLAESGQQFAVYDAENVVMYHYNAAEPLDPPQTHAAWMDGDRLVYVSGGKLTVFDYDYRNRQTLQAASPAYLPAFASDYSYIYAVTGVNGTAMPALTSTALTIPPKP